MRKACATFCRVISSKIFVPYSVDTRDYRYGTVIDVLRTHAIEDVRNSREKLWIANARRVSFKRNFEHSSKTVSINIFNARVFYAWRGLYVEPRLPAAFGCPNVVVRAWEIIYRPHFRHPSKLVMLEEHQRSICLHFLCVCLPTTFVHAT